MPSLTPSLQRHYTGRLLLTGLILLFCLVFTNRLYLPPEQLYQLSPQLPFQRLSQTTSSAIQLAQTFVRVLAVQLPAQTDQICYSQKNCVPQSLITQRYQTSTSFYCQVGQCLRASPFYDYFWLFRIRFKEIDAITISYTDHLDGSFNSLTVPSLCAPVNALYSHHWRIELQNTTLVLSKQYSATNTSLNTSLSTSLNTSISIRLSMDLDLSRLCIPECDSLFVHKVDGTALFGYKVDSRIIVNNWPVYESISLLLVFLIVLTLLGLYYRWIEQWSRVLFTRLHTVENLYTSALNDFFSGMKPVLSIVLVDGCMSEFYERITQLPDKQFIGVTPLQRETEKREMFRFQDIIKRVLHKFQDYSRPILTEKNREIVGKKHLLTTPILEVSENTQKKLKEMFGIAKQLHLPHIFLKYGYYSLLMNTFDYDKFVSEETDALPHGMVRLFRQMNRTVKGGDILQAFKVDDKLMRQTQEEIQIRIQDSLIQKYMQMLKQLDSQGKYAKQLQLERDLSNVTENIENLRFLLANQHNKNIRMFGGR